METRPILKKYLDRSRTMNWRWPTEAPYVAHNTEIVGEQSYSLKLLKHQVRTIHQTEIPVLLRPLTKGRSSTWTHADYWARWVASHCTKPRSQHFGSELLPQPVSAPKNWRFCRTAVSWFIFCSELPELCAGRKEHRGRKSVFIEGVKIHVVKPMRSHDPSSDISTSQKYKLVFLGAPVLLSNLRWLPRRRAKCGKDFHYY